MLAFDEISGSSACNDFYRTSRIVSTLSGAPTPPHTPTKKGRIESDLDTSIASSISHPFQTSTPSDYQTSQPDCHSPSPNFFTPPPSARTSSDHPGSVDQLYDVILAHREGPNNGHRKELDHIPFETYRKLRDQLERYPGRLRYNYDFLNEKVISYPNPSPAHESTCKFFRQNWSQSISNALTEINDSISWEHHASQSTYLVKAGQRSHEKGADDAFYVMIGRRRTPPLHPAFVIKVGYEETVADLVMDAKDWLLGSDGDVLAVLIVKFIKPKERNDFPIISQWQAFMQLYVERCVVLILVFDHVTLPQ
jgi:hypothetical protein